MFLLLLYSNTDSRPFLLLETIDGFSEKILFDIKAENDDISSGSESYSNSIVSVTNL